MQIQSPTPSKSNAIGPPILVLNKDLYFGVAISNALRELGFTPIMARSTTALETAIESNSAAALVIIDIAMVDDWDTLQSVLAIAPKVPSIAFGSHTNVEGLRSAKRIGMARVFSNGEFHRTMGAAISRYALPAS